MSRSNDRGLGFRAVRTIASAHSADVRATASSTGRVERALDCGHPLKARRSGPGFDRAKNADMLGNAADRNREPLVLLRPPAGNEDARVENCRHQRCAHGSRTSSSNSSASAARRRVGSCSPTPVCAREQPRHGVAGFRGALFAPGRVMMAKGPPTRDGRPVEGRATPTRCRLTLAPNVAHRYDGRCKPLRTNTCQGVVGGKRDLAPSGASLLFQVSSTRRPPPLQGAGRRRATGHSPALLRSHRDGQALSPACAGTSAT